MYSGVGDYFLVVDEFNQIVSRWFIIEQVRDRAGQYTLTLHRDLVADYFDQIIKSPMYIEKATLQNPSPLMYTKEDVSVNQIKLRQDTLKDFSQIPWLVGYLPKKYKNDDWIQLEYSAPRIVDIETDGIANWDYYKYSAGTNFSVPQRVFFGTAVNTNTTATTTTSWKKASKKSAYPIIRESNGTYWSYTNFQSQIAYTDYKQATLSMTSSGYQISGFVLNGNYQQKVPYSQEVLTQLTNHFYSKAISSNVNTQQEANDFQALQGKIIHDTQTNLYYKILIKQVRTATYVDYPAPDYAATSDSAFALMRENLNPKGGIYYEITGTPNAYSFPVYWTSQDYQIDLVDVSAEAKFKISDTDRYETADSAFDIFAIPYTDNLTLYTSDNGLNTTGITKLSQTSKSLALAVALQATAQLGQGAIYDLQLLPYCPCPYIETYYYKTPGWHVDENGIAHGQGSYEDFKTEYCLDVTNLIPLITGIYNKDAGVTPLPKDLLQIMLWATDSAWSFDINYPINIPTDVTELKIANQCDKYRLVSPTGSGQFEFNAVKNGGVRKFNVDCTYQPFNPYIHINPDFGELYGQDYNDWRGLICSGDFSLPQQTSAWADYKLQNKNYQESFDRTLQNMEVQQSVQRERELAQYALGMVSAGVSGATSGFMTGGGVGAAIGGALGTGLSAIGGAVDIDLNSKLRSEALDYTRDMFAFQLQNIQALPYGVTKSTPLTNNNPIFPIIEYYSCTDVEKDILRDKMKWNGMTIMAIGTIENYYNPNQQQYIKGKLIRMELLDEIAEDYHLVNAISGELDKGVFI